jgi:hypothetical protein
MLYRCQARFTQKISKKRRQGEERRKKGSEPNIYTNLEQPGHEAKLDWKSRIGVNA